MFGLLAGRKLSRVLSQSVNSLVLLFHLPLLYLINYESDMALHTSIGNTVIIFLVVAVFYPRSCHRYRADIFMAERFYEERPPDSPLGRSTPAELRGLYNLELVQRERTARQSQVHWLVVYYLLSIFLVALIQTYYRSEGEVRDIMLLITLGLFVLVAYLRYRTLDYRIPKKRGKP